MGRKRRALKWRRVVGKAVLLMVLMLFGWAGYAAWEREWFPRWSWDWTAAVENEPPPKPDRDRIPEIEFMRRSYRDAFCDVWQFSMIGVGLFVVCVVIISFLLIYTPRRIPTAKPFDPEKEHPHRR